MKDTELQEKFQPLMKGKIVRILLILVVFKYDENNIIQLTIHLFSYRGGTKVIADRPLSSGKEREPLFPSLNLRVPEGFLKILYIFFGGEKAFIIVRWDHLPPHIHTS